jgi:CO/xanthine dehydrogenase Mo-binding subunit
VADVRADSALVICSSQDIYATRRGVAALLGTEENLVRVQYREGSGTYGKSCYDDCAQAAALASQLAGAPIRLQFMRHDEHGWDTCGPPHIGEVRIGADADGRITAYDYEGWQHTWSQTETTQQLAEGAPAAGWPTGVSRSVNPLVCGGMYDIANARWTDHMLPIENWLRAGWLRSPLDLAFAFTSEQAVDDLAFQFGMDPVEYRRMNISDERWRGVLDAAAEAFGWAPRPAASAPSDAEVVTGRGIGLGTHLASWGGAAAEIEVNRTTGQVRILHLAGALDAGCVVNPDIVTAQIEGQLVQTVGRMLYEEVTLSPQGVTSLDWASYPVARFSDTPRITPVIVQRLDQPSSGAGEETMAAAAAAIANAFFDATGRRMRGFPFTRPRVLAALA